ncbi:MAG: FxsA family protein [Bacteroidetes bacterium]|nr:FxsA family protein [Bacteroidota bacterium]
MPWLFLLFVALPAIEIYLLIQLGQLIGGLQTFGLILATGLIGSYLAKKQGIAVWTELNNKLNSGRMPGNELIDGAIILVSGTLLVTPGVITDLIGILGLFPITRALIRKLVQAYFKGNPGFRMQFGAFGGNQTSSGSAGVPFSAAPSQPEVSSPNSAPANAAPKSQTKSTGSPPVELSGKAKQRPSFDQ